MAKIIREDKEKIGKLRVQKQRTMEKVVSILDDICKDNKEIFKKKPECRLKSLDSIVEKMKITICNISNVEKEIKDIAGARLTCCTIDEVRKVEDLIKKHPYTISCEVIKDYEKNGVDEYGYRGHHLLVTVQVFYENKTLKDTCEVQIRTLSQDLWAILSHRDFYKAPSKPPQLVQQDMMTLSKLLEVVDDLAVSLKKRRKTEIDKEIREKSEKLTKKDMLTPENIQKLIYDKFQKEITIDAAYQLIQYALANNITSLKEYKSIITNDKYQKIIEKVFNKFEMLPTLDDYFSGAVVLKVTGINTGKVLLREIAKELQKERKKDLQAVEKDRVIPKEELKKGIKRPKPDNRRRKR